MTPFELFLVELRVDDRRAVVAWYARVLGWSVALDDPAGDFSLLEGGGGRIAIKGGRGGAAPASVVLTFRVDDLAAELDRLAALGVATTPTEASPEGFVSTRLADPAGHSIQVFQWTDRA